MKVFAFSDDSLEEW